MAKILLSCVLLSVAVVAAMGAAINDEGKFAQEKRQAFLQRMLYNDNDASMEQPPRMESQRPTGPSKIDIERWEMGYPDEFAEEEKATIQSGVSYIRWGRTVCPAGAELVYAGRAAGSHYSHRGGGSNYQCITLQPENFNYGPGTVTAGLIYGSEYQISGNVPKAALGLHDHDVPCAVCFVAARTAKIMIPGTYKCPNAWTTEYYGYLMTERYNHYRSTFECVDKEPEQAISGHANHNGALFYFVEPRCGSLPCPPYDQQKEMTCAVCTR